MKLYFHSDFIHNEPKLEWPSEIVWQIVVYLCNRWIFLVAQLVKNLPAMQETPVWFLDWEDPLEKG